MIRRVEPQTTPPTPAIAGSLAPLASLAHGIAETSPVAASGMGAPGFSFGLDALRGSDEVLVDSLDGPDVLKRRLMEIGFVPGSRVRFEMATPFGDPLVYSLRGSKIALRRNEARCIRFRR